MKKLSVNMSLEECLCCLESWRHLVSKPYSAKTQDDTNIILNAVRNSDLSLGALFELWSF
jgi:hypothetical protein